MSGVSIGVTVGGAPLPPALVDNIVSLEVLDSIDALGAISLELLVPPTMERTQVLAIAKPGSLVGVTLTPTTGGAPQTVEGDLVEVHHREGVSRPWTITLRALDRLHRLRQRPRTKMWTGSHATVARTIATEHGFTPMIEGVDATSDFTLQANVPDAIFLKQLAARYNYSVRLEGRYLKFGRRDVGAGTALALVFGQDIVDFKLVQSLDGLVTDVSAIARNYVQNQPVIATAGVSAVRNVSRGVTGVSLVQTAFGTVWLRLDNLPVQNLTEATALATAELQARAERYVTGKIVCRGQPSANAGQAVTITGIGGYAGTYLVREVRHSVQPGEPFRTTLDVFSDSMPVATA